MKGQGDSMEITDKGSPFLFEDFEKWLSEEVREFRTFQTLGTGVDFFAKYNKMNRSITIMTRSQQEESLKSGKQKSYSLKHDGIVMIFDRWKDASQSTRYKASYYKLPPDKEKYLKGEYNTEYWVDPPDKIATPGIPAIIKYWVEKAWGK